MSSQPVYNQYWSQLQLSKSAGSEMSTVSNSSVCLVWQCFMSSMVPSISFHADAKNPNTILPYQDPSTFTFSSNNTWLTTWLTVDKHTGFLPNSNFYTKKGIYKQAQLILSQLYFTTRKINQQSPSLPGKWHVSWELSLGFKRSYFRVFLKNKQRNRTGRATDKTFCCIWRLSSETEEGDTK